MPHPLPKLPYAYDALEPHIDARTVEIHYSKHHQTYVNNLNAALDKHPELHQKKLEDLIANPAAIPEDIRAAVRNNGGGVLNHTMYWENMKKGGGGEPKGALADAIKSTFGGFAAFKEQLTNAAVTRFGSGWGWLVADPTGRLAIISTANQDSPLTEKQKPLLVVDVWEHAYYLKYQNLRKNYVEAWWNLVNWDDVAARFGKK